MAENAPGFTQACTNIPPYTLIGGPENIKLLFDEELDDRRTHRSFSQGWETLRLRQAQNAATIDHLAQIGLLQVGQTGATENQQNTSPAGQAAAEATKGAVGVAAAQVSANVADLATALIPGMATAITNAISTAYQMFLAQLPVLVTALGGASTPSQTQAKPTA